MLFALTLSAVPADPITNVSVNQSVSVSGSASITGGAPMSYSNSQTSSSGFLVSGFANSFNPANPEAVSHANSSASQSGNVSALGFAFAQQFSCNWSTPVSLAGVAGAAAATLFQISFTVTEAVVYQFTLSTSAGGGNSFAYSQQFGLGGLNFGGSGTYSGLLLPGNYVFTASQSFFGPPDVLGGAFFASSNGQMSFTSAGPMGPTGNVPESGGFACLLLAAAAIAGYQRWKRKEPLPARLPNER
jgi:hypothetical protein